ncbi:Planctomycete cytochrome C [Singulisphaera sp. GP187]|uniref:PSD1 and planctomycete cytochrome C domain-containing protein n=1 Tax=Singulisphaera sp. GP187 TaxID=1882752 RepID=UPI0009281883|nr:PSD1 and planctomycete cytochrome C domain-containing protein [Singulisphaera sp. GP187]SIO67918.1 Planctomycete cytochrome C [Singulisphaera sp. GP187]
MKQALPLWLSLFLIGTSPLAGAEKEPAATGAAGLEFFEARIRPVLVAHCYKCHSVEAGQSKGNLLLDARETIRAGGDSGPAVVPGDPATSLLVTAISHVDPDLKMPPKTDRLPDSVISDIKSWIKAGAMDPREKGAANASRPAVDLESGRRFWSFQKPRDHQPPVTKNPGWAKRDLDHFILAKLESHNLVPTADAEPATLLRRLHFDLVGLPPTPEELQRFTERCKADGIDTALAEAVEPLLASASYGERWGRHWLDVARFAESSGKEANISFPYAWRYRDYVIDAVNADMPFDRFLVEQIAGDLLPAPSDAERARLLIATGFLAVGTKNLDEANKAQFAADLVDEQIDALSRGVMANSVACARCHDHKLDPFLMEDYYALAGVFASTKTYFGTAISPSNQVGGDPLVLPRGAGQPILHASIPAEKVVSLKQELATLKKQKVTTLADALRVFWRSGGIEGELEKVDAKGQALPLAMGVTDRETIVDKPLLERGEIGRPGKTVPRGFPRVIVVPGADSVSWHQSGRLELARWLTHPDHPLTARVMTNRVWRHLFGIGIVSSVDNFGFSGQPPSHPELLDHLAVRFVADGWSVKQLVREIVLSRTYRQASTYNAKSFETDPENRLLWRSAKRRLDAEAIRDAMLLVSGELDPSRRVGSLVGKEIGDRPISLIGLDNRLPADLDASRHRSVYLPVLRDRLPDVLDLFDFAEPSLVTGDRETTNVPLQALYLMNSPFMQARAKALADRLIAQAGDDPSRIRRAFLLCYSRVPTEDEMALATSFLVQDQSRAGELENARSQVFAAFCQALLATAEFRNLD